MALLPATLTELLPVGIDVTGAALVGQSGGITPARGSIV